MKLSVNKNKKDYWVHGIDGKSLQWIVHVHILITQHLLECEHAQFIANFCHQCNRLNNLSYSILLHT